MPTVFVIAEEWLLRANARAQLRDQGIEALGMETMDDAAQAIAQGTLPDAIVLDAGSAAAADPRVPQLAARAPLIVVAYRSTASPALDSAATVLWRPLSIGEVVEKVRELLKGQAV
jgi:DNA-binding response OmpR family regulator